MVGIAVLRIVVSRDSRKNATATNQGSNRLAVSDAEVISPAGVPALSALISGS
jgi:hypothetical protein